MKSVIITSAGWDATVMVRNALDVSNVSVDTKVPNESMTLLYRQSDTPHIQERSRNSQMSEAYASAPYRPVLQSVVWNFSFTLFLYQSQALCAQNEYTFVQ